MAKLIIKSIFASLASDETDKMLEQLIRSRLVKKVHSTFNLSFFPLKIVFKQLFLFNQALDYKCVLSILSDIRESNIKLTRICKIVELKKAQTRARETFYQTRNFTLDANDVFVQNKWESDILKSVMVVVIVILRCALIWLKNGY